MAKTGNTSNPQSSPPKTAIGADTAEPRWLAPLLCLTLAAITWAVFGQTLHHQFVNLDDNEYVYENPVVAKGLSLKGAVWAFTYGEIGHWHPLTWLSHELDCQLYGLQPGGHHLTSVLLHIATVVLLFLVLRQMTGALWRSAFVAAVFAIHPLRVESVAWIAERKDVLSGVFFMLTLWAYTRYARQPTRGRGVAVAAWYGLGLLCKNMLMTLPFLLLVLDWWPLQRVKLDGAGGGKAGAARLLESFGGLVKEKIPLFLLAAGSCAVSFIVPEKVVGPDQIPFLERLGNALVSYVIYLWQMVLPAGLAIPYFNPPNGLPFWKVGLAFVLLAAISISVLACRKRHPYLLAGWLWYLGMLVPVIGFVQISVFAHADRYTYLPCIGLALAGTWAVGDWSAGWKHRRAALGGLMAASMGAWMACAWRQTGYWKSSETLWTHALACTTGNYVAHNNLGVVFFEEEKADQAITQYREALQIKPTYQLAHNNLGNALDKKGRVDEAISQYLEALQIPPDHASAHYNLGLALLERGRVDEALTHIQRALQLRPDYVAPFNKLGLALLQKGRVDEATAQFQQALQRNPDDASGHNNFGLALVQGGRVDEAITHFQRALQLKPDYAEACINLGNVFLQGGKVDEAIAQYQQAVRCGPDNVTAHNGLGNALLQKGRVDEALAQYQQVAQIQPGNAEAHNNLGLTLLQRGRVEEAVAQYEKALEINPGYMGANYNLGTILLQKGRFDDAISHFERALQSKPAYAQAHINLGNAFLQKGNVKDAILHYEQAHQLEPADPGVQNNLAWLLATSAEASLRNGQRAVELAQQANTLAKDANPMILRTLAAALAETGRFDEATSSIKKAIALARDAGRKDMAEQLEADLKRYEAALPFHQ